MKNGVCCLKRLEIGIHGQRILQLFTEASMQNFVNNNSQC